MPEETSRWKKYESVRRANKEYLSKFVSLAIRIPSEERERMKFHAEKAGLSLAQYIRQTLKARMDAEDNET